MFFRISVRFQKPVPPSHSSKVHTPQEGSQSPPVAAFGSPIVKKIPLDSRKQKKPAKPVMPEKTHIEKNVALDFVLLAPFSAASTNEETRLYWRLL
jgi:hypothetical protein